MLLKAYLQTPVFFSVLPRRTPSLQQRVQQINYQIIIIIHKQTEVTLSQVLLPGHCKWNKIAHLQLKIVQSCPIITKRCLKEQWFSLSQNAIYNKDGLQKTQHNELQQILQIWLEFQELFRHNKDHDSEKNTLANVFSSHYIPVPQAIFFLTAPEVI